MAQLRWQNAAVLAKLEVTPGTFLAPSGSTDGILAENIVLDYDSQNVTTNESTGSLDSRGPIPGGLKCSLGYDVYLKGSGIPGVAPEWDELMQICSWGSTVTKTDIGPAVTISITGGNTIADSGNGLAALTVGSVFSSLGFANTGNNKELMVATSAAGSLTVTNPDGSAPGLTNESAGASVTLRRGIAGVAAAAGSTTGFTAATPWAATDQLYRGMPVLLSGNPATPAWAGISDYLATRVASITDLMGVALSASTKLSIPANVLYKPVSNGIPASSQEFYVDGLKFQFAGMCGNVDFSFPTGGACKASFKFGGMFQGKSDAAVPTPSYDGTRPGILRASPFLLNRQACALSNLSLQTGAQMEYPSNPNQTEGFDPPQITKRDMAGNIDPYLTLGATRNIFADFRAGTQALIHTRLLGGNAANPGQRIALTIPKAQYTGYKPDNKNGLATENLPFFPFGQDAGGFLCIY
jgi:hypothetical protein